MKLLRRGAIALSLANLCYLQAWSQVLTYTRSDAFLMDLPPGPRQYLGLMTTITLLALLFFVLVSIAAATKGRLGRIARLAFLASLVLPIANIVQMLNVFGHASVRVAGSIILCLPLCLIVILMIYNRRVWEPRLVQAASTALLILSPMVVILFGRAASATVKYDPKPFANKPLAARLPMQKGRPRVIYAIFDEWDYRLAFEDRKPGLTFPNLDRLRGETLFTTNAHSPRRDTLFSVPSLLTGRDVAKSQAYGASKLKVRIEGQESWVDLDSLPNLFSEARVAGFNAAAVGWYLPYCRVFSADLVYCDWSPRVFSKDLVYCDWSNSTLASSIGQAVGGQPCGLFQIDLDPSPRLESFTLFGRSLKVERRAQTYLHEEPQMLKNAVDPQLGLVYFHVDTPHPPFFYDARSGTFDLNTTRQSGYLQNLALVDRTVGELRRRLEDAGLWNDTTLLLTSDHSFRSSRKLDGKTDPRVPFILKMAGSAESVQVDLPFNTLLTKDLLLAILNQRVSTPQQAARWIGSEAEKQPSALRTRTFQYE